MKKIALLFPYLRESGICKVPAIHSKMFIEESFEVDIIVRDDLIEYPYDGNLINLGVKSRSGFLKAFTYLELLYKVYRFKKQKKYDVVISHTPHCNFINVLTKGRERVITTTHITADFHNTVASMTLGFILKKSDYMVTVSKSLEVSLKRQFSVFQNKIVCIYNPVLTDSIKENALSPLVEDNFPYLLTVGRLSLQKAHWSLIKAFSVISISHPALTLIILGDGVLESALKQLVRDLGMTGKVLFKGFDNNPYRYMKNCKLFVLSSLNEGFPLVLLEAMASGAPILSSDCISGPREIITPESSLTSELDYASSFEFGYLYSNQGADENYNSTELCNSDKRLAIAIDMALKNESELNRLKNEGVSRLQSLSLKEVYKCWEPLLK